MKIKIIYSFVMFICSTLSFGQSATIDLPHLGKQISDTVFVPVTLENIEGGISTFQFYIKYDTLVLNPVKVNYPSKFFPSYEWMNNLSFARGIMLLTWLSNSAQNVNPSSGEVLCIIKFLIKDPNTNSQLKWVINEKNSALKRIMETAAWNEKITKFELKLIDGNVGVIQQK